MEVRIASQGTCRFCGGVVFVQPNATPDGRARVSHQTPTCDGFKRGMAEALGRPAEMESRAEVMVIPAKPLGDA